MPARQRLRSGSAGTFSGAVARLQLFAEARKSIPRTRRPMKLQQVSESCFAVLNEKNRLCDANSGLINRGGGVVIDTQSDLSHARRMIELFGKRLAGHAEARDQYQRER